MHAPNQDNRSRRFAVFVRYTEIRAKVVIDKKTRLKLYNKCIYKYTYSSQCKVNFMLKTTQYKVSLTVECSVDETRYGASSATLRRRYEVPGAACMFLR